MEAGLEIQVAVDFPGLHLVGEEIRNAAQELGEVDVDGAGGITIKTEGLLGDQGDSGELDVGGFEQVLDGCGDAGVGFGQIDEIGDSFERVVDLVGDGGGEATGGGQFFGLAE
jgi:hypothetical protein